MRSWLVTTVLTLLASLAATGALAQTNPAQPTLPLDRLRPNVDGTGFLRTSGGAVPGHLALDLSFIGDIAWQPLVLRDEDGSVTPVVGARFTTQLGASVGLFNVLSVSAQLPVVWLQLGGGVDPALASELGLDGDVAAAGIGDLDIRTRIKLLALDELNISLAALIDVRLPTAAGVGPGGATFGGGFLGDGPGAFSVSPGLGFSLERRFVTVHAQTGYRMRPELRFGAPPGEVILHPELSLSAGVGTSLNDYGDLPPVQIFLELAAVTPDRNPFGLGVPDGLSPVDEARLDQQSKLATVAEWGIGARYPIDEITLEGTIGTGLVAGLGAADLRVLLGLRWTPAPSDADGDGVGIGDVCPDQPEDRDGFKDADGCPEYDNDGDGLPDAADACPDEAEDVDGDADHDGCPDVQ